MSEIEIRTILDQRLQALADHDAVRANHCLDEEIVAFELFGALQVPAVDAVNPLSTMAWLESFAEGPHISMSDLTIYCDGSIAFCHSLNRLKGRRHDGQVIDVTMRSTLGLRQSQGRWKIVHGHTSVPREMYTGKAPSSH